MTAGDDEVEVVRDRRRDFGNTLVRIRVLRVPESETYPEGIKYAYHYSEKRADTPILRYDNHHGIHERHERHEGDNVAEIDFPGHEELLRQFVRELPDEVSP